MTGASPTVQPLISFAGLLRQLRAEARLTQEELAQKAGLSPRSISDLERGVSRTAHKDTALLLADALAIGGSVRTAFVAAARGRAPVSEVLAAWGTPAAGVPAAPMLWYPREDEGPGIYETKFGKLIDAMTAAAASEGGAIAGIWLIGLTAKVASETTAAAPGTRTPDPLSLGLTSAIGIRTGSHMLYLG
jgi:transcriptional regulator with XRE-family HTH domain